MNLNKINPLALASLILILVGALNWGMIGIFNIDVVALLFGKATPITRIIQTLVGLGGLYFLLVAVRQRK